jgi:hypothetical protein
VASIEDPSFTLKRLDGCLVVRIQSSLMFPGHDQNGSAKNYQWPQGADLGLGQRNDSVVCRDRIQHSKWMIDIVTQEAGGRHGDIASEPASGEVAEVDDP